ncbi:PaaI family thioesterase [Geobacter sp. SVR]|uniref:PaaI family thioesterase n=1 Tax=Geobacter sp. SVR TaxID=2495594 RepID=UPI00143EFC89|nr:PaaI family thioesterase [Geobacter sp. SVR]BCS55348.1 acyl-CoA thioesterase [Geobacter sp. SVR]GCF87273.1 acyl-CoA thioesterase [Geobacter sp. SVR]
MVKTAVGKVTVTLCPPVDLQGETDWTPFDAPALVGESLRFVSGDPEGNRFRTRYYRDPEQHLQARIWFGPETEGPPGHAHGGSVAAVLDEVLGLAAWAAGYPIVVGNLSVSFRNLLPLQKVVTVASSVVSAKGRKVMVHGRIFCGETLYAEGECLCITIAGKAKSPNRGD